MERSREKYRGRGRGRGFSCPEISVIIWAV
jgi:hypothetical protein